MIVELIEDLDECDAGWFARALERPVSSVERWRRGTTLGAQYGHFRVDDEPLFVKTSRARPDDHLRPFIANEFWFYRSLRSALPEIPTAGYVTGRLDDDGRYVLILDDLSARLEESPRNTNERIVRCLAALHRSTWEHAALERFPPPGEWRERVRRRTEEMCIDLDLPRPERTRLTDLIDDPCWAMVHERLTARRGVTLQHCDTHPGNFCFLTDGTACLIDWQRAAVGLPTDDLAHWAVFHGGDDVAERLSTYRQALPFDSFDDDFRASVVRAGLVLGAFWVGGRRGDDLIRAKDRVLRALDHVDAWLD